MKIMIVTPYFFPKIGGLENYALNIAKGLRDQGKHDVFIVTSNHESKKRIEENVEGLRVIRLPRLFKLSNTPINPFWYFQLKKIIKEEKPDVINAHSPVPLLADMAFFVRGKTPFVLTYHSGSLKKGKFLIDILIRTYENTVLKHILINSDEVISVYHEFIEKLIGKKRLIHLIQPGVDTNLFKPQPRVVRDKMTILYVGRIDHSSHWKGIEVLIRAIDQVKLTYPSIKLHIVGDGDAIGDYRKLANKLSLTDTVTFKGALQGNNLTNAYQSSTMLVLPSTTDAESFGMVLIEAMACGLPVIGSKIGGIPNVIKDHVTGLLVKPNSIESLALSISSLLEFPETAKAYANEAIEYISKDCNWLNKVELTDQVFTDTIKSRVSLTSNNVVHISAYFSPHIGGMEKVVEKLAILQASQGFSVQVITSKIGASGSEIHDLVSVRRLMALEIAHTPIMPTLFLALLTATSGSIFHVHVAQVGMPEIALLAARIKHCKVVMHIHSDIEPSGFGGVLLPLYKKFFLSYSLQHSDCIVVPTEALKIQIANRYNIKSKLFVVPAGVDNEFFTNKKLVTELVKPTRLIYVGRLSVEKNVPLIIEAVDMLTSPAVLTIVGDGSMRGNIESCIAQMENRMHEVKMVGNRTQSEVIEYYQQADIALIASNTESQSLVALEAMASATPLIFAPLPAVKYIVGDGGIQVDRTPEAFAKAITELMDNEDKRARLGKQGQLRARQFTWENTVEEFRKIYLELC